jgi:hypothetical protein
MFLSTVVKAITVFIVGIPVEEDTTPNVIERYIDHVDWGHLREVTGDEVFYGRVLDVKQCAGG